MKFLLDTHILLWLNTDSEKLSLKVKNIYLKDTNDLFLSKASLWEIAVKISLGKLSVGCPLKEYLQNHVIKNHIKILDISTEHILKVEQLEFYHKDPFDRLLIAQSLIEKIPVITNDKHFSYYPIDIIF